MTFTSYTVGKKIVYIGRSIWRVQSSILSEVNKFAGTCRDKYVLNLDGASEKGTWSLKVTRESENYVITRLL